YSIERQDAYIRNEVLDAQLSAKQDVLAVNRRIQSLQRHNCHLTASSVNSHVFAFSDKTKLCCLSRNVVPLYLIAKSTKLELKKFLNGHLLVVTKLAAVTYTLRQTFVLSPGDVTMVERICYVVPAMSILSSCSFFFYTHQTGQKNDHVFTIQF